MKASLHHPDQWDGWGGRGVGWWETRPCWEPTEWHAALKKPSPGNYHVVPLIYKWTCFFTAEGSLIKSVGVRLCAYFVCPPPVPVCFLFVCDSQPLSPPHFQKQSIDACTQPVILMQRWLFCALLSHKRSSQSTAVFPTGCLAWHPACSEEADSSCHSRGPTVAACLPASCSSGSAFVHH